MGILGHEIKLGPNVEIRPASEFDLPQEVKEELWIAMRAIESAQNHALVESKNHLII